MTTQIDICNRALLGLGARTTIASVFPSDGSVEANACEVLYQPTFEALARTAPWNCLEKQVTLSMQQAAQGTPENVSGTALPIPPVPWLYAYAYPSDCLLFKYIVPSLPSNSGADTPQTTINNNASTWLPTGSQIPYSISNVFDSGNNPYLAILTNQDQAVGIYNFNNSNPQLWDSLFQQAMVASLSAFLIPALSLSIPLMQIQIQAAQKAIDLARAQDGREGVTVMDHLPDWIKARWGGQAYALTTGFFPSGVFFDMIWPAVG